jgi:hypothetical protein
MANQMPDSKFEAAQTRLTAQSCEHHQKESQRTKCDSCNLVDFLLVSNGVQWCLHACI